MFTLAANYSFTVLSLSLFCWYDACSHQFAAIVADELHFSNAVVALKNLNGQKLESFF
jgi:hypothetical protein